MRKDGIFSSVPTIPRFSGAWNQAMLMETVLVRWDGYLEMFLGSDFGVRLDLGVSFPGYCEEEVLPALLPRPCHSGPHQALPKGKCSETRWCRLRASSRGG